MIIYNIFVVSLMECKPSAAPPNSLLPSTTWCSALSHAHMPCLCSYKNLKILSSFGIDPNLACKRPCTANC
ncbi:hypothetical protein CDL12_08007 [Handroanthus impetiginosus]|uniref:Bifunctional inhibitor/plant lipid transfer protein/seed storage helical domain-containing protein n=1 Tax=Handroanthus impetiginosus TaxID=429701 RepID=A0A2G9HP60_9LAMI|nr:hypothetical protein CDL12_08007 [Handroanthus impetiginosus]